MSIWTKEHFQNYLQDVRKWQKDRLKKWRSKWQKPIGFPQRFFDLVQKSGLYRCALPEAFGGYGMNDLQLMQVQEEYSRGPGGMRMYLHYAMGMNWRILHDFGSENKRLPFFPSWRMRRSSPALD